MQVSFVEREELAPYIWQYSFRPERFYDYIAGQYCEFNVSAAARDPRGPSRTFTLTSVPGDQTVSFVARFGDPLSAYKQSLQQLTLGDKIQVNGALGDLVLPKLKSVPLVFVAGGIGIASFVGMLSKLTRAKEERQIYLFYSLRGRHEYIFRSLIEGYPLAHKQVIYSPNRLSAQEIIDSTPPDALIYISGSQNFVESLRMGLEDRGVPRSRIIFDFFDGYSEL